MIKTIFPILGIDYGLRHIGFSISDSKGIVSKPLLSLHLPKENKKRFVKKAIDDIIIQNKIISLLVGIPQNFNETENISISRVKNFIKWLQLNYELEIRQWDESFSTKTAQNMVRLNGSNIKSTRSNIDSYASSVILQEFLNNYSKMK